jgi:hypothetical protein
MYPLSLAHRGPIYSLSRRERFEVRGYSNPLILTFYPKGHKSRREKERTIYTAVLHLKLDLT